MVVFIMQVISNIKLLMKNENEDSRSFLLDDDSRYGLKSFTKLLGHLEHMVLNNLPFVWTQQHPF